MRRIIIILVALTFSCFTYAQKTEKIKSSDLPKAATVWISQSFKTATINKAVKVIDNKTVLGYCAVVNTGKRKTVCVFDKEGKYLQRVRSIDELSSVLKPAQPAQPATPPVKK
jgi:hypothetical protein